MSVIQGNKSPLNRVIRQSKGLYDQQAPVFKMGVAYSSNNRANDFSKDHEDK
jgi:hypothetical protein